MSKELRKASKDGAYLTDYITVGDTVRGDKITEIWCTSLGSVMFCLNDNHNSYYNFKELLDLMPDTELEEINGVEEYKSVTSGR